MNNRSLWGEFADDKNEETTEAEIREDKEIYKKKKEDLKILNSKYVYNFKFELLIYFLNYLQNYNRTKRNK